MRRSFLTLSCLAVLTLGACEQQSPLGGRVPFFAFSMTASPTPAPVPTAVVAAAAARPTQAPTAAPAPVHHSGGSGGGFVAVAPPPAPAPTPTPFPLVPGALTTIGDPADALKIDGVRLDPDFATNGEIHLAFSVIADGADLTAEVDPATLSASMAFETGGYAVTALSQITVAVTGEKAQGRPPLDALLLIDSTGSMTGTDPNRVRVDGAKRYIDGMRPSDRVAVMDFSTSIAFLGGGVADPLANFAAGRLLFSFDKDRDAAELAVDQVIADGGTNLYDACDEGIAYLAAQSGNRPRALVVLTDGQDNASTKTVQDVAQAAVDQNVLLMMLAFADFDRQAMHTMVSDAGGYFVGAEDASQLDAQFNAAVRTVNGNCQAIIVVPADKRVAEHMAGRLTATIDGVEYGGTFNLTPPDNIVPASAASGAVTP